MTDKDVLLAKISTIQRCLKRIREVTGLDPQKLDDINIQDIFVLNLQRAIESLIDIAAHIVAAKGLGIPSTTKENFKFLFEAKIIDENLYKKMQSMAGFRNIAIHDYQTIKIEILKSILVNNLKDLENFYTVIVKKFL